MLSAIILVIAISVSEAFFTPKFTKIKHNSRLQNHEITVILNGEESKVMVAGVNTLLDELISANIDAPYSCKAGLCTECGAFITQESKKNIDYDAAIIDDDAVEKGFLLTCSARAKGPITIKLAMGEDMYEEQYGDFRREHESFQEGGNNSKQRGSTLDGILNLNTEA